MRIKFREKKEKVPAVLARELWFREDEEELMEQYRILTTIRAGDRTAETADSKGGYKEGHFIKLKIQKDNGKFKPSEIEAAVYLVKKKMLGEVKSGDLQGTSLKTKTKNELAKKLKWLYGKEFANDDMVTIIKLEYKDRMKEINDLIRTKILFFANQPKDNPGNLNFPSYTVALIEHDYPAKTPVMWNVSCQKFGIAAGNVMLVGDPKQCRQILEVLRKDRKYRGGGVGVGFKDEVPAYLDEFEPLAKEIGAVNFILKTTKGRLKGFNTDGVGYAQSLEEVFEQRREKLRGKKIVILGAGGTGNAIAFALAEKGAKIVILNRTIEKAENLTNKINQFFNRKGKNEKARFGGEEQIIEEVKDADAVINVSTKGAAGELQRYSALAPAHLPANEENIQENLKQAEEILRIMPGAAIVSDIVLGKELTPLLQTARNAGKETLGGIPMVINQGVEAFWILYGKELQAKNITKKQLAETMKGAANT